MRKNVKHFVTIAALAGLLGGPISVVEGQAKPARDRQEAPSKGDRNRQGNDESANSFARAQAERFEQSNKKNEDRNQPSKTTKGRSRR